jgi:DNA-binding GntR family transcriptional regulator
VGAGEEGLISFIATTFRSVWALELLCHLRKDPQAEIQPQELITNLRASELIVRRSLGELVAAGLVTVGGQGQARYAPATPELDRLAAEAEAHYARSPDAVRRIIIRSANPGLTAFSDAFRLGGDE